MPVSLRIHTEPCTATGSSAIPIGLGLPPGPYLLLCFWGWHPELSPYYVPMPAGSRGNQGTKNKLGRCGRRASAPEPVWHREVFLPAKGKARGETQLTALSSRDKGVPICGHQALAANREIPHQLEVLAPLSPSSPIHAFPCLFQSSGTKPLCIWWLGCNLCMLLVTAIPGEMPFSQGPDCQTACPLVLGLGCSQAELRETLPASAWGTQQLLSAGVLLTTCAAALIYTATHTVNNYTYNYIHCAVYM